MPLIITKPFKEEAAGPITGLCAGGESDFFGPGFWDVSGDSNIVYDGVNITYDLFQSAVSGHTLVATGGSWSGFRPSSVNITVTVTANFGFDDWTFVVRDTTNASIGVLGGQTVGTPYPNTATFNVPLTFGANDIGSIFIDTFLYDSDATLDATCFVP